MADDNRNRAYRGSDTYSRARSTTPAQQPAGDPLAELARLIGQQNESTPARQSSPRVSQNTPLALTQKAAPRKAAPQPQKAAPEVRSQPQDHYGSDQYRQQSGYSDRAGYSDPRGHAQGSYGEEGYGNSQYDPRYAADARYGDQNYGHGQYDSSHEDGQYGQPGYQDPYYNDPRYAGQGQGTNYAPGHDYNDPNAAYYGYGQEQQGQYADQSSGYGQQSGYGQYADSQEGYSDQYYDQGYAQQGGYGHQQGYGHSPYGQMPQAVTRPIEEEPGSRRRGGLVTVLAVLALAVVGTATAFGYRAMFGSSGSAVPPPVIKADTNPSKIVPATDPNSKPIQDRVGSAGEKIVPREEQPVEMREPARAGAPRVVFPNLAGQGGQPSGNVAPVASAPVPSEPKRVRTVTIKPDQGSEPAPVPTQPAARSSQGRTASAAPTSVDDILNNPSAHAPLALSPTNQPQAAPSQPAPQQPQRHASRTPANGSPFPAPITTGTSTPGPYAVQVTSQRTEADAQASYRALQQRFPSVLGSRQPVIRRADLGEKGTYYRAQIPFNTQGEASEFCGSLKSAGGQCVVQKN